MIMKPSSTAAGPPVVKAPPEPTKRPAPIAPPLGASQLVPLYEPLIERPGRRGI